MRMLIYSSDECDMTTVFNPEFVPRTDETVEMESLEDGALLIVKKVKYDFDKNIVNVYTKNPLRR